MTDLKKITKQINQLFDDLHQDSTRCKCPSKKQKTQPLKRRVTLVNYKGHSDPRNKNTLKVIQVTLPTELIQLMHSHMAETSAESRRKWIEEAIWAKLKGC